LIGLIIIGYHKKDSFCHKGIVKTIFDEYEIRRKEVSIIDLYQDHFNPSYQEKNKDLIKIYQEKIKEASHIYFVSPVWWFRCTSMLEGFFDQIFTPGFAYRFRQITKTYGIPSPLLSDKKVFFYLTHGAPALPVMTIYCNAVALRLSLGLLSFVFGWFKSKIRQFFSVPFCSDKRRAKYLRIVQKDVSNQIDRTNENEWFNTLEFRSMMGKYR
jgi:putative NADPH-quinone reductase